jgi:hypothetical protein
LINDFGQCGIIALLASVETNKQLLKQRKKANSLSVGFCCLALFHLIK